MGYFVEGGGWSISIVHNVFSSWSHWIPNELLMCFSTSQDVPNSNYVLSHIIFIGGGEGGRVLDFLDFYCSQCLLLMFPMNFKYVFQVPNNNSFLPHTICWKVCFCNLYRWGKKEDIDYNYILRVKENCLGEYSESWNFFILTQSTRPITNKIKLGQTLQLINSCHNKYLANIV
jgi:hypothetical protein